MTPAAVLPTYAAIDADVNVSCMFAVLMVALCRHVGSR